MGTITKPLFQNKWIQLLKKFSSIGLLIFTTTLLEIFWAMRKFSNSPSSSCLDCSFSEDAFLVSLITAFFLTIVFLALSFIKNNYLKLIIQLIVLISIWFFWNYTVFVERESSWSTYLFKEELLYTLSCSFLPVLVLSIITVFSIHYISKNLESK
jgi:hypothetical protein